MLSIMISRIFVVASKVLLLSRFRILKCSLDVFLNLVAGIVVIMMFKRFLKQVHNHSNFSILASGLFSV